MPLVSDSGYCADTLRNRTGLRNRREKSKKRLGDLRAALKDFDIIVNNILSNTDDGKKNRSLAVFCAGSLARNEAGDKSDLDLFITANDDGGSFGRLFRFGLFWKLMELNRELEYPPFSNDGEYLEIHGMKELKSGTGSRFDDSKNLFTARILLILESQYLANENIYREHRREVIEHYYRDRDRNGMERFRPLFILNDLLRYWRTVCLNYEERRHDTNRPFRKKNVNLKFSRKLTIFGTVLPLVMQPIDSSEMFEKLCEKTPLERLAMGLDLLGNADLKKRWSGILDICEEFLSWKEKPEEFLKKEKILVNRHAKELSSFLYKALTCKPRKTRKTYGKEIEEVRQELQSALIL